MNCAMEMGELVAALYNDMTIKKGFDPAIQDEIDRVS
jgi:hypothetical protein